MRLGKYIMTFGSYTKSETTVLFKDNRVLVNDKIECFSYEIKENDIIKIDEKILESFSFSYFLYYKPIGILSDIKNVEYSYINQINLNFKVMPCGRLDRLSEGLMILTNDGKFINNISNSNAKCDKEYIVTVKNIITEQFMKGICLPIKIKNRLTKPILANKIDNYNLSMILNEGLYHQIRKIVKANNNYVTNLKRIRIGQYHLEDLKPGEIREIKMDR